MKIHNSVLLASVMALSACATEQPENMRIGMPNPASKYCIDQGGKLEMKKDAQGNQYGVCHLPDGRVIEEWELFRSQRKK